MKEGEEESIQLIETQLTECKTWAKKRNLNMNIAHGDFQYIVENFRSSQIDHYIDWLHWCMEYLRRG